MNRVCSKISIREPRNRRRENILSIDYPSSDDVIKIDIEVDDGSKTVFVELTYSYDNDEPKHFADHAIVLDNTLILLLGKYSSRIYSISTSYADPVKCMHSINTWMLIQASTVSFLRNTRNILIAYENQIVDLLKNRL